MSEHNEREEIKELHHIEEDLDEIVSILRPRMSFVKIAFQSQPGGRMAEGPVTLTVGQKTTATLDGFDQNGAPMPAGFVMPPITWSIDNAALDSSTPQPDNSDVIASMAGGTANLTANVTSVEGKSLSDVEVITNLAQAPVLSSVKINFSKPV